MHVVSFNPLFGRAVKYQLFSDNRNPEIQSLGLHMLVLEVTPILVTHAESLYS